MKYGDKKQEKKTFKLALIVATTIHIAALFVFMFTIAWKPASPPPLNPGIELNLGFQDLGKSTTQPQKVEQNDHINESSTKENEIDDEKLLSELEEQEINNTLDNKKIEDNNTINKEILTEKNEEVPIKSEKKQKKKNKQKTTPPKKTEKYKKEKEKKKKVVEKKKETQKSKVDKSLFFKKMNKTTKKTDAKNTENNSGDKGNQGKLTKSGNYGASLNLSGWQWDSPPLIYDESTDAGKIVFKIIIDDLGTIMKVETIERTVTPSVEKKYLDAVKKLSFHSVGVAGTKKIHATGYITFILKQK